MKEPAETKTQTKGNAPKAHERLTNVTEILNKVISMLPADATRVEVDIEYVDGARVKVESKA